MSYYHQNRLKPSHHSIAAHSIHIPTIERSSPKGRCWKWYAEPVQHGNCELWLLHITSQIFSMMAQSHQSENLGTGCCLNTLLTCAVSNSSVSSCPYSGIAAVWHNERLCAKTGSRAAGPAGWVLFVVILMNEMWVIKWSPDRSWLVFQGSKTHTDVRCATGRTYCKTWTEKWKLWNACVRISLFIYIRVKLKAQCQSRGVKKPTRFSPAGRKKWL